MTWTRAEGSRGPGNWLVLAWLMAACANVLGIEEREVDTAANYPAEGYAGCRPGNCGACLAVHRKECEARASCADASESDDCAGCMCSNCAAELSDCRAAPGCSEIWACLRETRCDLSERAEDGCLQACASIIQASGGLTGPAVGAAAELRSCAASSACSACLAPQVQGGPRGCAQSNGCLDCEACFEQCLCSGERFGDCQRLCATEDAPAAACSEADACAGCTSCFDACACGGGSYDSCVSQCAPPTTPCQPRLRISIRVHRQSAAHKPAASAVRTASRSALAARRTRRRCVRSSVHRKQQTTSAWRIRAVSRPPAPAVRAVWPSAPAAARA